MSQPATLPGNWPQARVPARAYGELTKDSARKFLERAGFTLNATDRMPVALCVRLWRDQLDATETLDEALRRAHLDRQDGSDGVATTLDPLSGEGRALAKIAGGDPSVLLDRIFVITPVIDPVYDALLVAHGVERTGVRGYAIRCSTGSGRARRFDPTGLDAVLRATRHDLLCTAGTYKDGTGAAISRALSAELSKTGPYTTKLRFVGLDTDGNEHTAVRRSRAERAMRVSLSGAQGRAWLTVCTHPDGEAIGRGSPMDIWSHPERAKGRKPVFADAALEAIAGAGRNGIEVYDPDGILDALTELVANATVARPVPGRPGLACVIDGQGSEKEPARYELPATRAAEMIAARAGRGGQAHMHGAVADVAAMAAAKELIVEGEQAAGGVPLPRGPQAEIVGRHLATRVGFANASMMGTGKTSMTLWGMRLWARQTPYYRGLIVVAASHLTQWSGDREGQLGEIGRFFPEAGVLCPEGMRGLADQLLRADRAAGERPLLVVATYEQARRGFGDFRALSGWHDLVVDEAEVLANPHAQLSIALWAIRERALRAVALTGTPISKRTRDLHAIIAWAREDREMLSVAPPGDIGFVDDRAMFELKRAYGPALQRLDSSDMKGFMPSVGEAQHQPINGTAREKDLVHAATDSWLDLYGEIKAELERLEALHPDDHGVEQARRELASKRMLLLHGATAARIVALDPEAIYRHDSQAAKLIKASGLIEKALKRRQGEIGQPPALDVPAEYYASEEDAAIGAARRARRVPTRRMIVGQTFRELVAEGHQILAFSDFTEPLNLLGEFLANPLRLPAGMDPDGQLALEHGFRTVEAGVFTGETPKHRREELKARFNAGELPVLLLGPVGAHGHNLQAADIVCHYDLPWSVRLFSQRTHRAVRVGSRHAEVSVLIPILIDSIESEVVDMLIPRAALAHAALDVAHGRGGDDGSLARQLADLAHGQAGREDSSFLVRLAARMFTARQGA